MKFVNILLLLGLLLVPNYANAAKDIELFQPVIERLRVCFQLCPTEECSGKKYEYLVSGTIGAIGGEGKYRTWVGVDFGDEKTGSPVSASFLPKKAKHPVRTSFHVDKKPVSVHLVLGVPVSYILEDGQGYHQLMLYKIQHKIKVSDINSCGGEV